MSRKDIHSYRFSLNGKEFKLLLNREELNRVEGVQKSLENKLNEIVSRNNHRSFEECMTMLLISQAFELSKRNQGGEEHLEEIISSMEDLLS